MFNNLQAGSLVNVNESIIFLCSSLIKLNKKEFQNLKKNYWLQIQNSNLEVNIIKLNKIIYKAKLYGSNGYIFLDIKDSKKKKFTDKSNKELFVLKAKIDNTFNLNHMIISKNPLNAILYRNKKNYAKVDIYFKNYIYIKIKEIL